MRLGLVLLVAAAMALSSLACKPKSSEAGGADPLAGSQYALDQIHGRNPLRLFRQPPKKVPIAFIDTGVALNQPDLRPRLWHSPAQADGPAPEGSPVQGPVPKGAPGWDTIGTDAPPAGPPDASPDDRLSHGTPVASIAAAATNNGIGMAGVAPNALIMPVRSCWDPEKCDDVLTGASMSWAADNGARVENLSFIAHPVHPHIEAAIADHPEVLFVAAAANFSTDLDAPGPQIFPCEVPRPNVICVGASTHGNALASCSDYGSDTVDVAAPGDDLTVAGLDGFVEHHPCGSSLATPHVSGLAALLFGAVPAASALQVKRAILDGAQRSPSLTGKVATGGVIDVKRSLILLQDRFRIKKRPAASRS